MTIKFTKEIYYMNKFVFYISIIMFSNLWFNNFPMKRTINVHFKRIIKWVETVLQRKLLTKNRFKQYNYFEFFKVSVHFMEN